MTPIEEIEAERKRQITAEGWTAKHDDQWQNGELLLAAVLYMHAGDPEREAPLRDDGAPISWPWDAKWWKPKDRHRNLVRAGALCLAEKDRLRRLHRPWVHVNVKLMLVIDKMEEIPLP